LNEGCATGIATISQGEQTYNGARRTQALLFEQLVARPQRRQEALLHVVDVQRLGEQLRALLRQSRQLEPARRTHSKRLMQQDLGKSSAFTHSPVGEHEQAQRVLRRDHAQRQSVRVCDRKDMAGHSSAACIELNEHATILTNELEQLAEVLSDNHRLAIGYS
jgi:hypothetical protein